MGICIVDKWGFSVWTSWLDLCLVTDLVNLAHFFFERKGRPPALFRAQFPSVSHITIAPNGINSYMQTIILSPHHTISSQLLLQPTKTPRHHISPPGGLNIQHTIVRLPPGQTLRSCTSCFQFLCPCFQPCIFAVVQNAQFRSSLAQLSISLLIPSQHTS
jgi:hypothetical protein